MSSRLPATVSFSLERLARRGGDEGPHKDGWGIAYFEDRDCMLLREPRPASESPLLQLMERQGMRARMVISHIRLATFGARALRNTQPFQRELAGRCHVFAHNGDLPGLLEAERDIGSPTPARFRPLGDSDSEIAFCALLERLAPLWEDASARGGVPALAERMALIADYASELRAHGPANFIYCDADALFIHAHQRTQVDGQTRPPGMYLLQRCCWESAPELKESGVDLTTVRQDVALVASVPLTDELWEPLNEGELIALKNGLCHGPDGTIIER